MKKLLKMFSASVILGASMLGGVANAATCEGSIGITGPGSNNIIDCNMVNAITVNCDNNINVATVNYQNADSGDATASFNTSSGNAISGAVVNDNGTDVEIGASCTPAVVTPVNNGGGGGGGEVPAEVTPAEQTPSGGLGEALPEELPFTAANPAAATIAGGVIAATALAGSTRVAVAAYRRLSVK